MRGRQGALKIRNEGREEGRKAKTGSTLLKIARNLIKKMSKGGNGGGREKQPRREALRDGKEGKREESK